MSSSDWNDYGHRQGQGQGQGPQSPQSPQSHGQDYEYEYGNGNSPGPGHAHGAGDHTAVLPPFGQELPPQAEFQQYGQYGQYGQYATAAEAPAVTPTPVASLRTGSPIIAPGLQPAALTAALGLLLAGGAAVGRPALAAVLVLLQAVTAAGWFRLNGMWPARQGIVLAFAAGVTADIALLVAGTEHAPAAILGTLGVWLLLVLVLQLRHRGSADERLDSLTATAASTLITLLAAGYLAGTGGPEAGDPVIIAVVAVAVAALARALPLPGVVSVLVALAAAAGSGVATGGLTGTGASAALLALAAGAAALIGLRVASYDWPSRFVHFTAGVALPLTAAAPVAYVVGRAVTG